MTWTDRAACSGYPTEWWFPDPGPDRRDVSSRFEQRARFICSTCPVRRECLTVALERKETGIWAGLTESERKRYDDVDELLELAIRRLPYEQKEVS